MSKPTHAPGWRGRPKRIGPIEDDKISIAGALVELLEERATSIAVSISVLTLAAAAFIWAADAWAKHI